jgi:hypothetical protein
LLKFILKRALNGFPIIFLQFIEKLIEIDFRINFFEGNSCFCNGSLIGTYLKKSFRNQFISFFLF